LALLCARQVSAPTQLSGQIDGQNAADAARRPGGHVVPRRSGRTVIEPASFGRIRILAELSRLPRFSDLLWTLTVHRVRVRYKHSRLGIAWAILQPLSMMLVFTLMFSFLGRAPGREIPYPLFAYAALLPWSSFSSGLSTAAGSLTGHASLLTKVYFPREILPLTYVAAALVDMLIASTALAALMIWFRIGITWTALWAIPAVAIMSGFVVAAGLVLSALQVRYRDVALAMPVLLQVWLFASPVLYPLALVEETLPGPLYALYVLNPMAGVVDGFRRAVVVHRAPDLQALLTAAAVTAALLPAAYLYFKYAERTMADVV
jgi:lipopolysaccharide transport system permease protein